MSYYQLFMRHHPTAGQGSASGSGFNHPQAPSPSLTAPLFSFHKICAPTKPPRGEGGGVIVGVCIIERRISLLPPVEESVMGKILSNEHF
jgi:hypothetical protein